MIQNTVRTMWIEVQNRHLLVLLGSIQWESHYFKAYLKILKTQTTKSIQIPIKLHLLQTQAESKLPISVILKQKLKSNRKENLKGKFHKNKWSWKGLSVNLMKELAIEMNRFAYKALINKNKMIKITINNYTNSHHQLKVQEVKMINSLNQAF